MIRESLLMKLPEFRDKWELVKRKQSVKDIMNQIFASHEEYADQYDKICTDFVGSSNVQTLVNLFDFLKENVKYEEEPEEEQVIKSPTAIIETGVGDCKTYASFIGGVLDALKRRGADIEFNYVFAGYESKSLGHVFVEAIVDCSEYWIDPVLSVFDTRTPSPSFIKKYTRDMSLYKLSGVEEQDSPNGMGATLESCVIPYESMDQQIARLTKCSPGQDSGTLIPSSQEPALYDLPVTGDYAMTAPIDALAIDPGTPITMQSQPGIDTPNPNADNPSNIQTPVTTGNNDTPAGATPSTTQSWLKKNGVWVGIGALVLLALANKKKRRA